METSNLACRICQNQNKNRLFEAREMMFGFRDKFFYLKCSKCNCMQLLDIPLDMSKYYPENYYSFELVETFSEFSLVNSLKKLIRKERDRYALFNKGFFGKLVYNFFPALSLRSIYNNYNLTKDSHILDIGCGGGTLLYFLVEAGFSQVIGIDPYLENDIMYNNGLNILKKNIHDIEGKWDLIMFHHSFEHIIDPEETLCRVAKLLKKNGVCLIRIPTVSSLAWERYKENWVQLDAPRHFYLHSLESMQLLGKKASLQLERIEFDSTSFQFWGSEQYLRDIPLRSEQSYGQNPNKSIFSKTDIKRFEKEAIKLNKENKGDQAAFYFRKRDIATTQIFSA